MTDERQTLGSASEEEIAEVLSTMTDEEIVRAYNVDPDWIRIKRGAHHIPEPGSSA